MAEDYLAADDAEIVAFNTPPAPTYWQRRKDLYRERIAAYKDVPEVSHVDVIGFIMDAQIKAAGGDATEMTDIVGIIQGVKEDVPKP